MSHPSPHQRSVVLLVIIWLMLILPALFGAPMVPHQPKDAIIPTAWIAAMFWMMGAAGLAQTPTLMTRVAWTLGCITYLIHMFMAFAYAHHWSHSEAFEHIKRVGGFGAGIYVSYLFSVIWVGDVAWWWLSPIGYLHRPRWLARGIYGYMAFVVFNATAVFGSGFFRWVSAGFFALMILMWVAARVKR